MIKYILTLLVCLISFLSFAQKNKKPTSIRDLKILIKPIPIQRALLHDDIDIQLEKTDYLDGVKNDAIDWRGNEEYTKIVNDKIYNRAKDLKIYIENEIWDFDSLRNVNAKMRYLRQLKDNLRTFNDDAYDSNFDKDFYDNMFENMEGIMLAIKNNNLQEYVNSQSGPGIYVNRNLIDKNSSAYSSIIEDMCKKYPEMMLPKILEFPNNPGACYLMAYEAKTKENQIMSYATSTNKAYQEILNNCNDPKVKAIYSIAKSMPESKVFKGLTFLGDLMSGKKDIEEVKAIVNDSLKYFQALAELRINNEPLSKSVYNGELFERAMYYVRIINELHEKDDKTRFKCLEPMTTEQLYYMAVLCTDEIYTSSYVRGVFKYFMDKVKPMTGDEYLNKINNDKFRTFVRMCANYNTLDDFLATMKQENRNELMTSFVKGLGNNGTADLEGAVDVADAFGSLSDTNLVSFLQNKVREEYENNYNSNNVEGLKVYYILFSLFSSKYQGSDDSTFNATAENTLNLAPINKVKYDDVVQNGKLYEQVFFYGDEDGKTGYNGYMSRYRGNAEWKVDETNPQWVTITATKSKVPFTIFANKPLDEPKDEEAQVALNNYLIENEINPTIIIHRGHSYHLPHTLQYINDNHKIVILGSCGGYHNLSSILTSSPDAHIISSKQTGAFRINQPIIDAVNEKVYKGTNVDWVNIWSKLADKFTAREDKELFNDYVPPHKNLGALFIKSYKKLGEVKL